jgi:hypothetical protein
VRRLSACVILAMVGLAMASPASGAGQDQNRSPLLKHTAPDPPPDGSLAAEEYVKLGVPAFDRPWTGDDFAQAVKALTALAAKDAGQLPRHNSPRSGSVFARLISPDNLAACRDRSQPIKTRMGLANDYFPSFNAMMKLYLAAFVKGKVGDIDMIEVMGTSLRGSALVMELVDEFSLTLDKTDPKYKVRMDGLVLMKSGLATMIGGCLIMLTERDSYRTVSLRRLIELMRELLPAMIPHLTPDARDDVRYRLDALIKDPRMADLTPSLKQLLAAVDKAMPPAASAPTTMSTP